MDEGGGQPSFLCAKTTSCCCCLFVVMCKIPICSSTFLFAATDSLLILFMAFLTVPRYPSLLERVLGIHPVFAQRQSIRQVSFDFMTRELLWHGFAVSISI